MSTGSEYHAKKLILFGSLWTFLGTFIPWTNASTNHDGCTKKSSSDLQAHCLCLLAPRVVGRTRCKLNCTNCPNGILKYIQNWLWCSFSSCMRRWNSSFLSLLSRRSFFVNLFVSVANSWPIQTFLLHKCDVNDLLMNKKEFLAFHSRLFLLYVYRILRQNSTFFPPCSSCFHFLQTMHVMDTLHNCLCRHDVTELP